jgi:hypothetical protein
MANNTVILEGTTTLSAAATDRVGSNIVGMTLVMDGTQVAAVAAASVNYQAIFSSGGTHTFYATASDALGSTNSTTNTFYVDNGGTVTWISPTNGYTNTYGNGLTLTAGAYNTLKSITSVAFYDNGSLVGSGTPSGTNYSITWPNNGVAGNHTLEALSTDSLGATSSSTITIYEQGVVQPSWTIVSELHQAISGSDDYIVSVAGTYDDGNGYMNTPVGLNQFVQFIPPNLTGTGNTYVYFETTAGSTSSGSALYLKISQSGGNNTWNIYVGGANVANLGFIGGTDTCRFGFNSSGNFYATVYSGTTTTVKGTYSGTVTYSGSRYLQITGMPKYNQGYPPSPGSQFYATACTYILVSQ